jgi:aminoglycoside phosphotransferase (APT) family kinase protein
MDVRAVLDELVAAAALPPVASTRVLREQGFDNQLLVGVLVDGRQVLLRQSLMSAPSPSARAKFLFLHDVGAPRLYAANDAGAVLVDYVPGETLAAAARRGTLSDREWHMVGTAYRRIHAVQFPTPLRGPFGPDHLELTPEDPVDLLHNKIDTAEPAVRTQRPALLPSLYKLRRRIDARAAEFRREVPCLAHTDANFHNIIVAPHQVTLIDWDYPAVRYPLEELGALEDHAYLNGVDELPAAFFAGYGRDVSRPLLRIHRIVGCLGTLSSSEWSDLAADSRYPEGQRSMIRRWNQQLGDWIHRIDDHLDQT